jgi:hypothetical protein
VKLARAVKLELRLFDQTGRVVASWSRTERTGTTKLKLVLPAGARKAGHDTLRVTVSGTYVKTVPVVLRA